MTRSRAGVAMKQRNGFTLLETLVVLVVFGFLILGLSQGTRVGMQAWGTETTMVNNYADMDAVERVLRNLVAEVDPGEPKEGSRLHGEERTISFPSRMSSAVTGFAAPDVDVGLGVDMHHRLVLRLAPHPHAEQLMDAEPPNEVVLLESVDRIEIRYLDFAKEDDGWTSSWSERTLPRMIRLKIFFVGPTSRHWPEIVAAPMRISY